MSAQGYLAQQETVHFANRVLVRMRARSDLLPLTYAGEI